MVYQIECAWCRKDMGTKEGEKSDFALELKKKGLPIVSHSMCSNCKKTTKEKYGLDKKEVF